jgi:transcriptional repressor NrdR
VPIVVIKQDGQRESFDRSKLLKGIVRACQKTGIPAARLEEIVDEIESELQQRSVREVSSYEIGELVLQHLRSVSEVAYVRFASVCRQFQGIRDFVETLNRPQSCEAGQEATTTETIDGSKQSPSYEFNRFKTGSAAPL